MIDKMPKKKLSKGFEDLFSQNETELSFLDTYGKVNSEGVEGLPESTTNIQNSDELFDVIVRFLKSEQIDFKLTKKKISIDEFFPGKAINDGIRASSGEYIEYVFGSTGLENSKTRSALKSESLLPDPSNKKYFNMGSKYS